MGLLNWARRAAEEMTPASIDHLDRLDNRDPQFVADLVRLFKPALWRYFRPQVEGLERIPAGAALLVGNHNGALTMPDVFILGMAMHDRFGIDGVPYGLAHQTGLRFPLLKRLFIPLGGVRARTKNGLALLSRANRVLVYPGGELDSMRAYRDRDRVVFGTRRGYVRLALAADVPIVPIVSSGAHETLLILDDGRWLARLLRIDRLLEVKRWPISLSVPWGLWIGVPPPHFPLRTRVRIEILEPIRFDRTGHDAAADRDYVEECHRRVHGAMQQTLSRLVREERS